MIERIVGEPFFLWSLIIVVATPLLLVGLGELIVVLERRSSPYLSFWRYLRHGLLPTTVALLIARFILTIPADATTLLFLQTLFWGILAITCLILVQSAANASEKRERWEAGIPGLFFGVTRVTLVLVPLYYVISIVWGVELGNLFAALGIGSLVIALALQDTLSNLVSGFLLAADKPFAVGDWIEVEGHTGKVLDLNWRSVRLQVRGRDVLTIPNSALSSSSIYNYTLITPSYREHIAVGFSYNDPPNKVKRMLLEAAAGSDQLLNNPPPSVLTVSYDDSSIGYELVVYVKEYRSPLNRMQLRDEILTRIYYCAQRYGINIPFPIRTLYHFDGKKPDPSAEQREVFNHLQPNFYFATLDEIVLEHVAAAAKIEVYSRREVVISTGQPVTALFLIIHGRGELKTTGTDGDAELIDRLGPGDIFGENVLLGNRPSSMTLTALEDLTVVRIPTAMINEVVERNPRFALALDELVEERLRTIRSLREKEEAADMTIPVASVAGRQNGDRS